MTMKNIKKRISLARWKLAAFIACGPSGRVQWFKGCNRRNIWFGGPVIISDGAMNGHRASFRTDGRTYAHTHLGPVPEIESL